MFATLHADPPLERRRQDELRAFAASLAPDFEETAPGTFLLDLLTLPQARSAPRDWIGQALRRATPLRLPLRLALASTPDLALLAVHSPTLSSTLAFHPEPAIEVRHREVDVHSLASLPLSSLKHNALFHHSTTLPRRSPSPEGGTKTGPSLHHSPTTNNSTTNNPITNNSTALLSLWGIHTLGDLAALPRQGLAERLGPDTARLHDILHGKHHRLLRLHRPPQQFQIAQDLEHALDTLEPLLFLLRRGLDTLCARLAASQRAAIAARLTLTFDDGNLHLRDLRLPEPTRDPDALLRLLHTHLATVRAPAPAVAWSLHLTPALPGQSQHQLFERSLRDPNKFADTLARLEALLGPDRLGAPVPRDTHQPDRFDLRGCGVLASPGVASREAQVSPITNNKSPITSPPLPRKRYRPPLEISVASELRGRHLHPLALLTGPHRGRVAAARGPFPLSGSWWDPAERWQRVEWDLQLADRTLLRLAHEASHRWLLEGIYE